MFKRFLPELRKHSLAAGPPPPPAAPAGGRLE
jgi:hypothetical protein